MENGKRKHKMKLGKKKKRVSLLINSRTKHNHKNNKQSDKTITPGTIIGQQKKLEEFFLQGRQEYLNLFKTCPVALVYTNIDGIILYVNHYFEELTGFSEDEIKGNTLIYCLKPEEHSFFEDHNQTSFETIIRTKNNSRIEVMVKRTWNQIDNRIAGMIFSFQDISFLKKERKLKQTLYRISQLVHSELSLPEIYPLVHEQLKKVIVAANFYIALWDTDQKQLSFPYYTDEAAGDDEIFIQRYSSAQSIFHYILDIGKPVLMDFQHYRKMLSYGYIQPWDVMTNTHLWLAVPLKVEQKVIGVLALQSYDNARLYSEKDIDLLEFIAQQLSTVIYRKEMEEILKSMNQKMTHVNTPDNVLMKENLIKNGDIEQRKKEYLS